MNAKTRNVALLSIAVMLGGLVVVLLIDRTHRGAETRESESGVANEQPNEALDRTSFDSVPGLGPEQRGNTGRAAAQRDSARFPVAPYTAPNALGALTAIDRLPVGHPERARVLTSLLLLCNSQGLQDSDAGFDSWVDSGWIARSAASRLRFDEWLAERRIYCAGVDELRIESLRKAEVSAQLASTSDDALMALVQQVADGTWRLSSDPQQQEVEDHRLMLALGRLENRAEILAKPEIENELWRMALRSSSPTVAETVVPLLLEAQSGPFADATSEIAAAAPPGMPWRGDLPARLNSILHAAATISICRRLGHCGPGSLRSLGMGPDTGGRAVRDGVEGRLRDALSPEEWRLVNLFLARVDEYGRSRAVR